MHKELHSRDDIYRLYALSKEIVVRLTSLEEIVDALILGLKDYIKKSKEIQITAVSNRIVNIRTNKATTKTRKLKWEEKQLYVYFK